MSRITLAAALTATLSSAAGAQALPKATLLADWERDKGNVLAYVDAMPDSALKFRPTPGVRDFAEQIDHIVSTNLEVAARVLRGASNIPALGDSTKFLKSKSALKAYAAATYDYVLTALREATPAQLLKESKLFGFPLAPAWRWLELSHEHSVWTLGQTIPYLRLNRVKPPAYNMPF